MLFKVILHALSHLVLKKGGCSLNCPDGVRNQCSAITNVPSNQGEYISGRDLSIINEGKKEISPVILESKFLRIGPLSSSCTLHNISSQVSYCQNKIQITIYSDRSDPILLFVIAVVI